jgi:hypothetical protein
MKNDITTSEIPDIHYNSYATNVKNLREIALLLFRIPYH